MRLREGKLISEWKDEHGNRALIEIRLPQSHWL